MKIKKIAILIMLVFFSLYLTGCWDNTDLTKLAIATAVGIDKHGDNYVVSVQIVKTANEGGNQSGGGNSQSQGFFVVSGEGSTIFEGIRSILNKLGRKVFYSNVQEIIIDDDIAKQGISDVCDFFERQHEPQLRAYILIAQDASSKEILETTSEVESISGINISQVLEDSSLRLTLHKTTLLDLLKNLKEEGREPMVGLIKKVSANEIKIEGAAVFKNDKMKDILTPYETKGYELSNGNATSGIITIHNPAEKKKNIEVEIRSISHRLNLKWSNGKPVFIIKVEGQCEVAEIQGTDTSGSKELHAELEKEVNDTINNQIMNTVEVVQQRIGVDIYGFGEYLHKHAPDYWHKMKNNWDNEFCSANVKVDAKMIVIRTGQIKQKMQ